MLAAGNAFAAPMQGRVEMNELRKLSGPIAAGARVQLDRIPVGDTVRTFDLERFEVWAPNAEIVVEHADGSRTNLPRPAVQYFRGTVDGDPDSMVFMAVAADGQASGLVVADDVRYSMRPNAKREVVIDQADTLDDFPIDGSFSCGVDGLPVFPKTGVPSVKAEVFGDVAAEGTLSPTATHTLNLAIDTDFELYQDMGSNAAAVTTFIGNVIGAVSTIYKRDLRTDIVLTFSRVHTSASDPFNVVPGQSGLWNGSPTPITYSTFEALAELGDIWHDSTTRPFNGPRSSVVLMSGKSQTAGVAWIGRSCTSDSLCQNNNCGAAAFNGHYGGGYAYIGLGNPSQTVPNPDATVGGIQYGLSGNYWPVLGVAHELGHNVDGPHTHCFSVSGAQQAQYGITRGFIDQCSTAGGCYSGSTSAPAEKGTVMSYCHLLGSSQSRFLFGKAGEVSELMKNHIMSYISSVTPNSPSISAPSSVGPGGSGVASINSPGAGLTFDWSITNGTINGATTGTSVNFTASANPVTLRARATNTNGCSSTESVSVTVNSCVAPAITSMTQSMVITQGTAIDLLATASGTGPISYQWYVGTSGNTSTPTATGNPVSATPTSTTSYWVRATNSCGSVDSATITLTVVVPPTTPVALYNITPCRVIDTRNPTGPYGGPALASGSTRVIQMTGRCGIPSGAASVVANLTAVTPTANGMLAAFPTGITWPGTSNLSYRTGKTRAANSILYLSGTGQVSIYNSGATQHFIIDVTGYFQ